MKHLGLLFFLLASGSARGQEPWSIADAGVPTVTVPDAGLFSAPIYADCPEAPPAIALPTGEWMLPKARGARVACLLAVCETDRAWRAHEMSVAPTPPGWTTWAAAVVSAAIAGFGAGVVYEKFRKGP